MGKENTAQRKLSFILYNYTQLKRTYGAGQNATVLIAFKKHGYSVLDEVNIALGLRVVDELLNYYRIENNGVDKFIELYFFKHRSYTYIAGELHISERTAHYWKVQVIDRAELIAAMLKFN